MSESFKKFRKTGKIEDYLKYKEETSKELVPKKINQKPQVNQNKKTQK